MSVSPLQDKRYNRTVHACFFCYIVQAVVINFYPLLFLTFQKEFGISLSLISLLIGISFATQLATDLVAMAFIRRISYRVGVVSANICAALGLSALAYLPSLMPEGHAFWGILISVVFASVGGGLIEVFVSPLVEACPSSNKAAAMSLLHSFYCWGHAGVILLSVIFFALFDIGNYRYLALLFALIPAVLAVAFFAVPIPKTATQAAQDSLPLGKLLRNRSVIFFVLLMILGGAAEQSIAQWASAFTEQALGISKTVGDLVGPMLFAICMGLMRTFYGVRGDRMNLSKTIAVSALLCSVGFLLTALSPIPALSLFGCALTGVACGIFWPGTLSTASRRIPLGGPLMFTLLAVGGDIGCLSGPSITGFIATAFGDDLRIGLLCIAALPFALFVSFLFILRKEKRAENKLKGKD